MLLPLNSGSIVGSIIVAAALLAASTTFGNSSEPLRGDLVFDVLRDGVPVGHHKVIFSYDVDGLKVDTVFELKIELFSYLLYSLDYSSQSHWRDGKLLRLNARTDDNGTVGYVRVERQNDFLKIKGPNGTKIVRGNLNPTNHWNVAVTKSDRVLNTITGRVNAVRMMDLGSEYLIAEGRTVEARRWAYTGDLQNEVWYDQDGNWVKMRFDGKDGSTIEYVCRRCLGRTGRAPMR